MHYDAKPRQRRETDLRGFVPLFRGIGNNGLVSCDNGTMAEI